MHLQTDVPGSRVLQNGSATAGATAQFLYMMIL